MLNDDTETPSRRSAPVYRTSPADLTPLTLVS